MHKGKSRRFSRLVRANNIINNSSKLEYLVEQPIMKIILDIIIGSKIPQRIRISKTTISNNFTLLNMLVITIINRTNFNIAVVGEDSSLSEEEEEFNSNKILAETVEE